MVYAPGSPGQSAGTGADPAPHRAAVVQREPARDWRPGCVSNAEPECPEGLSFNGTKCASPRSPDCTHEGTKYDPETQSCIAAPPGCPEGTDLKNGECVLRAPPQCPEGTELKDDLCITIRGPECEGNLTMVDGRCVSEKPPNCSDGTTWDGSRCVIGTRTSCFNLEVCPPIGAAALPAPSLEI
ncbi:hypothetical protein AU210_003622 [Fusarium oxysporum f. sp. radicis-cucumerinum]|uniref:Uncharacterized protein n=1 Tax=Fusarium oxysporum f. sp. radicis-cucumerinum TaxID=327505 RepID=A0A2H3HQM7_FUSOX|nr:hypothetical protein AU210_003622 [Fusarium oxysporum f. sp. radicis-cucumerinum]